MWNDSSSLCLIPGLVRVMRYTPLAKERSKLSWGRILFVILLATSSGRLIYSEESRMNEKFLMDDILTPYPGGRHGSSRTARDVSNCQHFVWENRTYEQYHMPIKNQWSDKAHYEVLQYADVVHKTPLRRRYAIGTIAKIDNPYYTLSVLEPKAVGGCEKRFYSATRSTVQETIKQRQNGCHLAANAGYFVVHSGECLGNIVSDGRIVKSTNGIANANFGIKEDGTIVVGYISEEDIRNQDNPFRQLISGVVWLVRNGTNYVKESMKIECSDTEETGSMKTFVEVLSSRSAIGHDKDGRLVLAHIEGQTHMRGANLYEFADLLVRKGVVNAINLDGGGSTTFVQDSLLTSYATDHCHFDAKYRCPREVSTVICVHDPECLDPTCSDHGSCDKGACSCADPWTGETCNMLNCSLTNCSGNGVCDEGKCQCKAGYTGDFCNETCPSDHYGPNCAKRCFCYGKSVCHPIFGNCTCPAGLMGSGCWKKCPEGRYGRDCTQKCAYPGCSGHGHCSKTTGVCQCEEGWTGISCNDTIVNPSATPIFSVITPTFISNQLPEHSLIVGIQPSPLDTVPSTSSLFTIATSSTDTNDPTALTDQTASTATNVNSSLILADSVPEASSSVQMSFDPAANLVQCDNLSVSLAPSTADNSNYQSMVTIVVVSCFMTIVVHMLLCVFTIHCRSGMGGVSTRAEIKQELMERRRWEKLLQLANEWTSDSEAPA